jgi:hypothetical protein
MACDLNASKIVCGLIAPLSCHCSHSCPNDGSAESPGMCRINLNPPLLDQIAWFAVCRTSPAVKAPGLAGLAVLKRKWIDTLSKRSSVPSAFVKDTIGD